MGRFDRISGCREPVAASGCGSRFWSSEHRQECVRSHDILYRVLSGHPLHFGPVRAQKKEPSEEGEDGLGNCAR